MTGKLSDFAGMIVVPVLMTALAAMAGSVSARLFHLLFWAAPAVFFLINISPDAANVAEQFVSFCTLGAVYWKIYTDPTDLFAFTFLPIAWVTAKSLYPVFQKRFLRACKILLLVSASAATVFTSQPVEPQFQEPFHEKGCILQTVSATTSTISIQWYRITAYGDITNNAQYRVYYSLSPDIGDEASMNANGTLALDWFDDVRTFTLTGLNPNTVYYINVLAADPGGEHLAYCMLQSQTTP